MKGVFLMSKGIIKHTLEERILIVQSVIEKKKSMLRKENKDCIQVQ